MSKDSSEDISDNHEDKALMKTISYNLENISEEGENLGDIDFWEISDCELSLDLIQLPVENTLNSPMPLPIPINVQSVSISTQTHWIDPTRRRTGSVDLSNTSFSMIGRESKRKDALEEYFWMTVLSHKVSHQDLDQVCMFKPEAMYL